tara:strand:+ start:484 stop:1344 length:861 start_codon:yes stop_codon:yes gene_type:complete
MLSNKRQKINNDYPIDEYSIDDYPIDDYPIDEGMYSYIYNCKINKNIVIKIPKKEKDLNNEALIYNKLKDLDCVIKVHAIIYDMNKINCIKIIMEKAIYNLFDYIRNLSDEKHTLKNIIEIYKKVCIIINKIHKKKVWHLDIKLDNILVTKNNELLICDFGNSEYNYKNEKFCQGPIFCKPIPRHILAKAEDKNNSFDMFECEHWSLGIFAFELVFLKENIILKEKYKSYNILYNWWNNFIENPHHNYIKPPLNELGQDELLDFLKITNNILENKTNIENIIEKLS